MFTKVAKEKLQIVPPETDYLAAHYVLELPADSEYLKDAWKLRKHALDMVQAKVGDEVQLTAVKVKRRRMKNVAKRIFKRQPTVHLYVTVKF